MTDIRQEQSSDSELDPQLVAIFESMESQPGHWYDGHQDLLAQRQTAERLRVGGPPRDRQRAVSAIAELDDKIARSVSSQHTRVQAALGALQHTARERIAQLHGKEGNQAVAIILATFRGLEAMPPDVARSNHLQPEAVYYDTMEQVASAAQALCGNNRTERAILALAVAPSAFSLSKAIKVERKEGLQRHPDVTDNVPDALGRFGSLAPDDVYGTFPAVMGLPEGSPEAYGLYAFMESGIVTFR